jgi:hypothetical protein
MDGGTDPVVADRVTVEGLARLASTMRRAGLDLADLKSANASASSIVASWASLKAPRRTGRLGTSVRPTKRANGARVLGGGAAVPYAGVIHWGWPARHIGAQPFISEAAQSTEPVWQAAYERDIARVVATIQGA